jgi:hypothetical protein
MDVTKKVPDGFPIHHLINIISSVSASCSEVSLSTKLSCFRFFHALKRS